MVQRLKRSGMEVCVVSHVDLSPVLDGCGVQFRHLCADARLVATLRAQHAAIAASSNSLLRPYLKIRLNWRARQQSVKNGEVVEFVEQWQPDLLLIDMECHVAIVQLMKGPTRILLCSRWFTVFRTDGIPPMHTTMMPARNWRDKTRIQFTWWVLWGRKYWRDIQHQCSRRRFWPVTYASNHRYDLACIATYKGFKLQDVTNRYHWLIPHVYTELPVMSLTTRSLEFGQTPDLRMHYVGPMVGQHNAEDSRLAFGLQRLNQFLKRSGVAGTRPLVYCSFSTFWRTDHANYEALLSVFQRRQDLDLVIGLGGAAIPAHWLDLPENVLVLEYAPQIEVLRHADVVITHGGISTINEALFNAVPLIVCSSGHVDQDGCLARVVYHGVGVAAHALPLSAGEIECLLLQVLGEKGHRLRFNVREIQRGMQQLATDNTLVNCVNSYLPVADT